nr:MFS transporter [Halobacterium salinarum]WJK64813.1 MFS transporter [Halobacterium salinarum]
MTDTVLRENRSFRRLLAGETVIKLGGGLRGIAIPWLVLELTGSPVQLGVAMALRTTPDVVVAPILGYLIDSLPRKPVAIVAVAAEAACVAAVPVIANVGTIAPIHVYTVLAATSITRATYHNSRESMLPDLVGDADLDEANSLFYIVAATLSVAFMVLGGIATSLVGPITTLAGAAGATGAAAFALLLLPQTDDGDQNDGVSTADFVSDFQGGVSVMRGSIVRDVLLFGIVINIATVPYSLLITVVGHDVFGLAIAYAVLMCGFQSGKIAGNYGVNFIKWGRERKYVVGIGGVGIAALLVAGGGTAAADLPPLIYLTVVTVLLAVLGAIEPLFNVPSDSLVQVASEEHRGIVITLTNALLQAPFPVALLLSGYLVETVSPFVVFGLSGVVMLGLAVMGTYRFDVAAELGTRRPPSN